MATCPECGKLRKDARKEWDYAVFHLKLFNCETCGKTFKVYYYDDRKESHTIPKKKT